MKVLFCSAVLFCIIALFQSSIGLEVSEDGRGCANAIILDEPKSI